MFLKLIKDFFIKKDLNKKSQFFNESSSNIAILIDINAFPEVEVLKKWLREEVFVNNNIFFILFDEKMAKNKALNSEFISSKSLNWNGKFTDALLLDFCKNHYKVLIVFSNHNLYINHIAKSIFSIYKFGFSSQKNNVFDVSLSFTSTQYKTELVKYLKSFNLI